MRPDGRTDITKLIVAFRNFAKVPNKTGNICINVTLRNDCVTFVIVKSCKHYIFWVCVCNLSYSACNAHKPYCHLWSVRVNNFSTLSHKRHDFRKKLLNRIWVFWFSVQFFSEIFLILRRRERDIIHTYIRLHVKYPLFLSDFNEYRILPTMYKGKSISKLQTVIEKKGMGIMTYKQY